MNDTWRHCSYISALKYDLNSKHRRNIQVAESKKTQFRPLTIGYKRVYDDSSCAHEREEWNDVVLACSSPRTLPGAEADIADDESVASDWEEYCDDVDDLDDE